MLEDLDLPRVEAEALVDCAACGSSARSLGRKMRVGQLSISAEAMVERSMSASDWVANRTATFFLRKVLSHSRMRAANSASSRKVQASSRISSVGRPSKRLQAVEQVGQDRSDQRLVLHQRFHLEVQHVGDGEALRRAIEQPAVGAFQV